MTQQELRNKYLYYQLYSHFIPLGMKQETIDLIIATQHSADTLYRLASIGNIT